MNKEFSAYKKSDPKGFSKMIATLSQEADFAHYFTMLTWGDIEAIYELVNYDPFSSRLDNLALAGKVTPFEKCTIEMMVKTSKPERIQSRKTAHHAALQRSIRAMERFIHNEQLGHQISALEDKMKNKADDDSEERRLIDKVKKIFE